MDASAAAAPADRAAAERRLCERACWAVLALLFALLAHSAWANGPTYDEHFYIAAGRAYLHDWEFALNREHPPLLKLLAGLPLVFAPGIELHGHWRELVSFPVAFFYEHNADALDRNLLLARLPFCLLTVVCALGVYRTGLRLFSPRAGLLALLLFAFNPNVLAHGPLAALDMGIAVMMFFALKYQVSTLSSPKWSKALLAALFFGLANLAKFTGLLLIPIYAVLALVACWKRRSLAPLGWTLLVALGGLTVFAAGYGFEAKSVWQAWAEPNYKSELRGAGAQTSAVEIAAMARAAGAQAGDAQRIERCASPKSAADELASQALDAREPARARAGLRALSAWSRGPGELRKRACARLLSGASAPELAAEHLNALSGLCDMRLPSLEAAQRFYEREQDENWDRAVFTQPWLDRLVRGVFGDARPIPLFSALKGIDFQLAHGKFGHGSYFRGETIQPGKYFERGNPHPEYYAWLMGIKNPLCFLLLCAAGLLLAFKRAPEWTLVRAVAVVGTPVLLFLVFSRGSALLGIKYLLPVFPFLCVLAGRVAVHLPRLGLALGIAAAAECLWIHPHELMYYNLAAGGPKGGPAISVVGDDWGQDVRELGRVFARNRELIQAAGGLYYELYSTGDPAAFGLEDVLPLRGPVRGIVAVNAINYYREAKPHAWLREYEPFERIGWSVWLYDTRVPAPGGTRPAGWR